MRNLTTMKTNSLSSSREEKEMIMIVMKTVGNSLAHRRNPSKTCKLKAQVNLHRKRKPQKVSRYKKVRSYKLSTSVNTLTCLTKSLPL